jgi:hypothetical protein
LIIRQPAQHPPEPWFWAEVEEDLGIASRPLIHQAAAAGGGNPKESSRVQAQRPIHHLLELRKVCLPTESINHPDQLRAVEGIAGLTLPWLKARVLKLKHPSTLGLHIGNMLLAVFVKVDDLLPILRKLVLPGLLPAGVDLGDTPTELLVFIPEPNTALLLGLGLVGLAAKAVVAPNSSV